MHARVTTGLYKLDKLDEGVQMYRESVRQVF